MAAGEKLPLTERVFYAFDAVSRWVFRKTSDSRDADRRANRDGTLWGCVASLIRIVIIASVVVFCPLFMLPMMLTRLAQVGRQGFRYGASVAIVTGDEARWGSGALPAAAPVAEVRSGLAAIATRDQGFRVRTLTDWAVAVTASLA